MLNNNFIDEEKLKWVIPEGETIYKDPSYAINYRRFDVFVTDLYPYVEIETEDEEELKFLLSFLPQDPMSKSKASVTIADMIDMYTKKYYFELVNQNDLFLIAKYLYDYIKEANNLLSTLHQNSDQYKQLKKYLNRLFPFYQEVIRQIDILCRTNPKYQQKKTEIFGILELLKSLDKST